MLEDCYEAFEEETLSNVKTGEVLTIHTQKSDIGYRIKIKKKKNKGRRKIRPQRLHFKYQSQTHTFNRSQYIL